ncbi:MAG TPA: glycosyltransferase, partial [Candidatus Elarobacter sp.]|nr:glycosyltransferase [Candidatus Elarobacter sp.]
LGFIESHREALEIVASADVGLLPHQKNESWDTTIPNKLFDYMAAGLPVVTSDAAPCERIVHETGCGEVFASGNAEAMAAAIRRATDPSRSARLGDAGVRAVLGRYNWEHDTEVLLAAVESLLEQSAEAGDHGYSPQTANAYRRAARTADARLDMEAPPV